ncbi:hypothetical protein SELMODRAFT_72140, partial [Selaginella moellendorffii]
EAFLFYSSMLHDYGIQPGEKHVVCMVDIFASSIPLAACQVHGDADTGLRVARPVPKWDSDSAAQYVGFSNV